jgi:hypothetical protein
VPALSTIVQKGNIVEWISVNDRLPEDGDAIIAYGKWTGEIAGDMDYQVSSGTWDAKRKFVILDSDYYTAELIGVTHWMPLPPPPKE